MQAQVLIVEDEKELAELVSIYLGKEGIESLIAEDAESALSIVALKEFDLVILDINLPGMDGFEFLQRFRRANATPVVILSAREADEDIMLGLGIGADEFVGKPFAPKVLVARIRALIRRARSDTGGMIGFGPYKLDVNGYALKKDGVKVKLSSKEFEILRHLVLHAGVVLAPSQVYQDVWNNQYGDPTSVAVYVRRIRLKIEEDPQNPQFIQTVHGSGYRFNPETLARGGDP